MTLLLPTHPALPAVSTLHPKQPKVTKGKKPAAAPYPGAKPSGGAAKKNPLFEKKPKNFGIGTSSRGRPPGPCSLDIDLLSRVCVSPRQANPSSPRRTSPVSSSGPNTSASSARR